MANEPTGDDPVQTTYDKFWRDIIEPHGVIEWDCVLRELHDYAMLLEEVPKVYNHITAGRISKPNTLASGVIAEADEVAERQCREDLLDDLGIDPDLPLNTLRRRLLWGERLEGARMSGPPTEPLVTREGHRIRTAAGLAMWLTRDEEVSA